MGGASKNSHLQKDEVLIPQPETIRRVAWCLARIPCGKESESTPRKAQCQPAPNLVLLSLLRRQSDGPGRQGRLFPERRRPAHANPKEPAPAGPLLFQSVEKVAGADRSNGIGNFRQPVTMAIEPTLCQSRRSVFSEIASSGTN